MRPGRRSSWRRGALLAALLLVSAARPGAAAAESLWEALPFAELLRKDLGLLDHATLTVRAETLRQRLFIDEQTIAIERGEDLELVVGYAAAVALLAEREPGRAGADRIAGARRSAAFLLHATGHLCATEPDLRIAVAELGALDDPAARALAASVMAMRRYGREAFEALLAQQGANHALGPTALAQAGRLALTEGEAARAAVYFVDAAAHEPLPRFGVAACEALLMTGAAEADDLCRRLEARFSKTFPAVAERFGELRRDVAERLASERFAADPQAERDATPEELAAEAWRRAHLGQSGAAQRLARTLRQRFPLAVTAWHSGAEIAVSGGSLEALETLLDDARRHAVPADPRLASARLAILVNRALERGLGKRRPLEPEEVRALETALADRSALPADDPLLPAKLGVVVALAAQVAREDGASERLERALEELMARGAELDMAGARLVLLAGLLRERWSGDAARVLATIGAALRPQVSALVARVELGLALRTRDRERLERAAAELSRRATANETPALAVARIVAARSIEVLAGDAIAVSEDASDRRALAALAFAFDETSRSGRLQAQARAFTLATLEQRAGESADAGELLREARRFGGEIAALAAGQAQLLLGDLAGAAELCARADSPDPAIRQLLTVCRALGAAGSAATAAWSEADDLWDAAALPPMLAAGTARPLFVPDFAIEARLDPGAPLALDVRFEPVVLLVPELAPGRVEVRRRAGR